MEDLLLLLIGGCIGWYLGAKVTTAIHILSFKKIIEELNISEQQLRGLAEKTGLEIEDPEPQTMPEVEITLEKHGDQIYAYRKSDDHFLGQGKDRDTLIAGISKNLNNVKVVIGQEDGADLIRNG